MQYLSKDILLIITATVFILLISSFIIIFIVIYQQRQQNYAKEKEEMQNLFQQELLKTQLEIQEATFKTISQEIHDNIGQSLSFIKLNINTINLLQQEQAQQKLNESKDLLTKAIQDLRDLSKSLNTDFITDLGLVKAVEQLCTVLNKTGVYKASLNTTGTITKYDIQKELVIFRVVQELLNNIVKHAEATVVNADIDYQEDKLCITIRDNGKGFDTSFLDQPERRDKGIGLYNIINRLHLINGTVQFHSKQNEGTLVTLQLNKT